MRYLPLPPGIPADGSWSSGSVSFLTLPGSQELSAFGCVFTDGGRYVLATLVARELAAAGSDVRLSIGLFLAISVGDAHAHRCRGSGAKDPGDG